MMRPPHALKEAIYEGFGDLNVVDTMARGVLVATFEHLNSEDVQREVGERIVLALPDLLPHNSYDRRVALGVVVAAVCHVLGER